jgi:hypothetical protein
MFATLIYIKQNFCDIDILLELGSLNKFFVRIKLNSLAGYLYLLLAPADQLCFSCFTENVRLAFLFAEQKILKKVLLRSRGRILIRICIRTES